MDDKRCVGYFHSPLGFWEVKSDHDGVTSIRLLSEEESRGVKAGIARQSAGQTRQHAQDCLEWLKAYFHDASQVSGVKYPVLNTSAFESKPFCRKVWNILRERVKSGMTVSYGELAQMVGNPNAARAVGMAMKSNPTPLIVPCHRVVSSNGIGYYSAVNGTDTKRWLLEHEEANMEKFNHH